MWKGREKKIHKRTGMLLGCLLLFLMMPFSVKAEENVHFGSKSYRWERGTVNPLGVYVTGDGAVTEYEVCLRYDPSALRYVDGADSQEGDLLYLRGGGSKKQYKTMLHFEALQDGDTQLEVLWATGKAASGQTAEGAQGQGEKSYEPVLPQAAPITVYWVHSSRLNGLFLEGRLLEGFSPDVAEYFLEVPEETEYLELSWETEEEGAVVTVSGQTLAIGENRVTVTVRSRGQEQDYLLTVVRMAEPAPTPEPEPVPTADAPLPEPTPGGQEEQWQGQPGEHRDDVTETEAPPGTAAPQETADPQGTAAPQETADPQGTAAPPGPAESQGPGTGPAERVLLAVGTALTGVLMAVYAALVARNRRREKKEKPAEEEGLRLINLEDTAVRVSGVTMRFRMAKDEASSLKEYLIRTIRHQNQYSWLTALDNVSFEVKQGDVVGIIGTNGSGKSTLLKIVSGALIPTRGTVQADRSKVQMLTLGTGFDMELTAKENVYLNGSIIGYTREYIDEKYEDIVRFAELEGFMDERMKNFSSGMVSRLGFAIATMRDAPDILILDEVLSVGDTFFQKKSMKRIKEMIHGGATVLIVSHSMATIRSNCNKAVWIEKGKLQMAGDPAKVCAAYEGQQGSDSNA